jgi:DNA-binding transcriptional ArsR family regulator
MITIHITPDDLVNIRFAYRPLLEIPFSYHVLSNPTFHAPFRRWVEEARRALYDVELPYLHALVTIDGCYIPDFLCPTPTVTNANIEDDFEELLATPDALIRENIQALIQIDGDSAIRQYFIAHPRDAMQALIEELRLYWQHALESNWSRMMTVLEGDILYRGRLLAMDGPCSLFEDLHPTVKYHDHCLKINRFCQRVHAPYETSLRGEGIQLVPSIFNIKCMWQVVPGWRSMLSYPTRGAGLWFPRPPTKSLELALGAARAQTLQLLATPATTGEVAYKARLSSATASQHLKRLTQAGLAEPHRSGKRVYYQLTHRGEELIGLFDRID